MSVDDICSVLSRYLPLRTTKVGNIFFSHTLNLFMSFQLLISALQHSLHHAAPFLFSPRVTSGTVSSEGRAALGHLALQTC